MLIIITGNRGDEWVMERRLSRMGWDETVEDIAAGNWKNVSSVLQTSTGFDVLPQIARCVMNRWAERDEGLSGWERDFVEANIGIHAANKFRSMEDA